MDLVLIFFAMAVGFILFPALFAGFVANVGGLFSMLWTPFRLVVNLIEELIERPEQVAAS